MFDHVTIRVPDREASEAFYELVLRTLEIGISVRSRSYVEWDDFAIALADVGTSMMASKPSTRGLHIAFVAPSREHVNAFWRAGTEAGYRDNGVPGPRPQYREDYYGAFLLDPDGNSVEAVHHGAVRRGGWVDHLWIRVADIEASQLFYETIAPIAGFRVSRVSADRAQITGVTGLFSIIAGKPTAEMHLAFPAPDDATVKAFHRTATAVGYRDMGAPGVRAVYHAGYYAAFVLDPDGNNVELVHHNRPEF
ncbi:MAG TPA: VOC family protein [Gaiellaceae bacterium]|nr:VOC family protein [Gaiellaceae bacterium]